MTHSTILSHRSLLIVGAGGHGRMVADSALLRWPLGQVFATDDNVQRCTGELLPGVPILKTDQIDPSVMAIHVAIGVNAIRERVSQAWGSEHLVTVVHPMAAVSRFARVGTGSFVAAQAVIAPGAQVGMGVIVNHGAVIDHDSVVGAFTHIAPLASLGGGVTVGKRVLIGAGAVILPGMTVVDDVIVGAGAVVCSPITVPGTYVGVPARALS